MIDRNNFESRTISFIRIISMLMILFCHIFRVIEGMQFFNQLLSCGVFTFLYISGYLYGKSNNIFTSNWLFNRFKNILIPLMLWGIIYIFLNLLLGIKNDYITICLNSLGLSLFTKSIPGYGHLYFITIILICYCLTPLLKKFQNTNLINIVIFLFIFILMEILLIKWSLIFRAIIYIAVYIIAFYASKKENIINKKKNYILLFFFTLLLMIFRFIVKKYYLLDNIYYDYTLVYVAQLSLGIFVFYTLKYLYFYIDNICKGVIFIDQYCYEIYIIHFYFIIAPISLITVTNNIIINLILTLFVIFIGAYFLKKVDRKILTLLAN